MSELPDTLPKWLARNARLHGRRTGQRHKRAGVWRQFSWSEIEREVDALAFGLAACNLARGETVVIISENRPEQYWVELAAMSLGARIVALYPDASEAELDYVVGDTDAVAVFAEDQEQVDKILPIARRRPCVRTIVWAEDGGMWDYDDAALLSLDALKEKGRRLARQEPGLVHQARAAGAASDIALLSYTSGATGKPKGVVTTHASLLHNARAIAQGFDVRPDCEYLSYIPLSWATEQWIGVALGLMGPMCVNFAERPDQIQEAIRELACDMVFFGPRQWESLAALAHNRMADAPAWRRRLVDWAIRIGTKTRVAANDGQPVPWAARLQLPVAEALVLGPLREQLGLRKTRIALTGGAATAPDVFRLFAAMGVTLRNVYGCSEVGLISGHVVSRPVNVETVGAPVGFDTPWGKAIQWRLSPAGELEVKGGTGFAGYWNKPEKTAECLHDGWYRTGDAMSLDKRRGEELVYLDRVDHMSRLASGHAYPKQFIESRLRFSPYIKEVMAVGDARHGFVTALVNIDGAVFSSWAERHGIAFTTFADLSQRPEVVAQVGVEIERVNAALPEHSRVRRFANLPKELDADEGELTRTRKLKRDVIEARYAPLIDALYLGAASALLEVPVRYQDGRSGVLKARVRLGEEAVPQADAPPGPRNASMEALA